MKLKIASALLLTALSVITYKIVIYDPVPGIVDALRAGKPVTLDSGQVYNFTGYLEIPVKYLDLNNATIIADSMLQQAANDNKFLFVLDSAGTIKNGTIRGASGRTESIKSGWFGAVKCLNSGIIQSITFNDCDKWAIYALGNRTHTKDTVKVELCVFNNTRREGYGYGVWNQYATVTVSNCKFGSVRHGIDCGSEANITTVMNNEFRGCFYIPIHQHRYKGDSVGMGVAILNNIFYDNLNPTIDIGVPFSGRNIISNNLFIGSKIGVTGRDSISIGDNKMTGYGMKSPPIVTGRTYYQFGERMTLKASGYSSYTWNNGVRGSQTSTTFNLPMVKAYSVYGNSSLSDTITVLCADTGSYFGFYAMSSNATIQVFSGERLIKTISGKQLHNYGYYFFRLPDVCLRVFAPSKVYLDNIVRSGGFYDTFEEGLKVKVRYYGTGISVSRPYVNQLDGFRCLMIGKGTGYVEVGR